MEPWQVAKENLQAELQDDMRIVSKPSRKLEKTQSLLQFTLCTLRCGSSEGGKSKREKEQATKGCSCPLRCESLPNHYRDLQGPGPLAFRCLRWVSAAWWGKLSAGWACGSSRGAVCPRKHTTAPLPHPAQATAVHRSTSPGKQQN